MRKAKQLEESKRAKGRVLEDLVDRVLQDMGVQFDPTFKDGYTNKKGKKYPDFINNLYNIEVKNWSCKRLEYTIDEFRYYTQIDSRFDPSKGKILIITDPMWSQFAKGLASWNGVNIISLGIDDLECDHAKAYWTLREKLTDFFISEGNYLETLIHTAGEIVFNSLRKVMVDTVNELTILIESHDLYRLGT